MDCSIILGNTFGSRLLFAALAYVGLCAYEKVECAAVQEAGAPDVGMTQKSISNIHSIHHEETYPSRSDLSERGSNHLRHTEVESLDLSLNETLDKTGTSNITPNVTEENVALKEINYSSALRQLLHLIGQQLSMSDKAIWCLNYFRRNTSKQSKNNLSNALHDGRKETFANDIKTNSMEDSNIVEPSKNLANGKTTDMGLTKSNGISNVYFSWVKSKVKSAKECICGNYENPANPKPSIKQRFCNLSRSMVKTAGRKIVDAVNATGNILGINDELDLRIRNIFQGLFYLPQQEDCIQKDDDVVFDEYCFEDKIKRLNQFYSHEASSIQHDPRRAAFYAPITKPIDTDEPNSPFKIVQCSKAAHYLVTAGFSSVSLCTYIVILTLLIV
ncbi:putative integral membrane protein [Babesia bovis T2Bo]|uniref:Membrane protein, putative n=1 Tax=Babesia bovis TaxID=5865 RepID=A7AN47_BABBO|nr:putative integral membrane protein [Babesia bovis T2Bo]EDO07981.1 putative integral membrane protein [Babesia bovis T2Bo]|eukprot:XP_001611549.1 membrane protein [Babesia bovis T2Bo]